MVKENIYISRKNVNRLEFRKNGTPISLNAITKIDLFIEDLDITISDEVSNAYPIKWLMSPVEVGILEMQIGMTENLKKGIHLGKFYIYSVEYPTEGIFWCEIKLDIDI